MMLQKREDVRAARGRPRCEEQRCPDSSEEGGLLDTTGTYCEALPIPWRPEMRPPDLPLDSSPVEYPSQDHPEPLLGSQLQTKRKDDR